MKRPAHFGLRWQSGAATPLSHARKVLELRGALFRSKAPSPLRSPGAVHNVPVKLDVVKKCTASSIFEEEEGANSTCTRRISNSLARRSGWQQAATARWVFRQFLSLIGALDVVEHAAVGEVRLLRLSPAAKGFINGDEFQFRKLLLVFFRDGLVARAVEVFRRDFLTRI